jgi:hypothetical protein
MVYMPSQLTVFRLGLGLGAKLSDKVQPTIGWMRAWAKLSENSSAPNRLLVSVSAAPACAARRQRHEMRNGQSPFEQRIGRVHAKMHEGLAGCGQS